MSHTSPPSTNLNSPPFCPQGAHIVGKVVLGTRWGGWVHLEISLLIGTVAPPSPARSTPNGEVRMGQAAKVGHRDPQGGGKVGPCQHGPTFLFTPRKQDPLSIYFLFPQSKRNPPTLTQVVHTVTFSLRSWDLLPTRPTAPKRVITNRARFSTLYLSTVIARAPRPRLHLLRMSSLLGVLPGGTVDAVGAGA